MKEIMNPTFACALIDNHYSDLIPLVVIDDRARNSCTCIDVRAWRKRFRVDQDRMHVVEPKDASDDRARKPCAFIATVSTVIYNHFMCM